MSEKRMKETACIIQKTGQQHDGGALSKRLWQRICQRSTRWRLAARAECAAVRASGAVCGAVVGYGVHGAACAEPALVAIPHPARQPAPAVCLAGQYAHRQRFPYDATHAAEPAALGPVAAATGTR